MVTFILTSYPILKVLEHGGRVRFDELANELMGIDPRRFRDVSRVEEGIEHYSMCLKMEDGYVVYDKEAKNYAAFDIHERDTQALLHNKIPDMEKFELYPFKTRKNSDRCYIGISWEEIPVSEEAKRLGMTYEPRCNFSNGACTAHCGVDEETLRKYGLYPE
jgi:hypothetical protein